MVCKTCLAEGVLASRVVNRFPEANGKRRLYVCESCLLKNRVTKVSCGSFVGLSKSIDSARL